MSKLSSLIFLWMMIILNFVFCKGIEVSGICRKWRWVFLESWVFPGSWLLLWCRAHIGSWIVLRVFQGLGSFWDLGSSIFLLILYAIEKKSSSKTCENLIKRLVEGLRHCVPVKHHTRIPLLSWWLSTTLSVC